MLGLLPGWTLCLFIGGAPSKPIYCSPAKLMALTRRRSCTPAACIRRTRTNGSCTSWFHKHCRPYFSPQCPLNNNNALAAKECFQDLPSCTLCGLFPFLPTH